MLQISGDRWSPSSCPGSGAELGGEWGSAPHTMLRLSKSWVTMGTRLPRRLCPDMTISLSLKRELRERPQG